MNIYIMFCRHIKIKNQNLNLILYELYWYGINPSKVPMIKPQTKIPNSIAKTPSPTIEKKVLGEIKPCNRLNINNIAVRTYKKFITLFVLSNLLSFFNSSIFKVNVCSLLYNLMLPLTIKYTPRVIAFPNPKISHAPPPSVSCKSLSFQIIYNGLPPSRCKKYHG